MKKPKVCFVTTFFYPVIGGVENHIFYLSKELIKKGYDVEVYTSDLNRDIRINKKIDEIDKIKIFRFKSLLKVSFGEIIFPGIFKAIKNSDADIFHVHGFRHNYNLLFLFTKKPLLITPHFPIYRGQRNIIIQLVADLIDIFLGRYIFKKYNKICVVTEIEKDWIKSFSVSEDKIILTPNAIPDNYFRRYNGKRFRKKYNLDNRIVILTMSRIHKSKGIDQIIKVAKYFPEAKFVIMGKDGGEKDNLIKLSKSLQLNNVIFAGEVSEKEKLEAYAGSDIFCSPSHFEGFCISILEAMSQGCAVITSNKGGMPWVVGKYGLIFKDNDLEDLKEKLKILISNKKILLKYKSLSKVRVKKFRWNKVADTLDKEYKKLINNQKFI
ncbi:MAG: glycosyltransferase family 4 protein [Candidatus Pacearchaeota archaeon]